jgi:hypothetical protein
MGVNRKILVIGSMLIGAVLIFCIVFSSICYLKEPVFLYHYYEMELPDNEKDYSNVNIALYYITNISDTRQVVSISFDELPDTSFNVQNDNRTPGFFITNSSEIQGRIYGRYRLHTLYIYLNPNIKFDNTNKIQLSNATISFNNGEKMHADLGKIILFNDIDPNLSMQGMSYNTSSDGWTRQNYTMYYTITLESMGSSLFEELQDIFEVTIDDKKPSEIAGQKYTRGSQMHITTEFKTPSEIIPFLSVYDLKPKISYHFEDGRQFSTRFYSINYNPANNNITFTNLFWYLVARGKL